MKTLTIEYKLYLQELKQAKMEGFEHRRGLYETLRSILDGIDNYDHNKYRTSRIKLAEILTELERIKLLEGAD